MGRYLAANPQPNDELNKDSHTILSHLGVSGDFMFLANDYDYAGYATATVWVIEVSASTRTYRLPVRGHPGGVGEAWVDVIMRAQTSGLHRRPTRRHDPR